MTELRGLDTFCPYCKRAVIVTPFADDKLVLKNGKPIKMVTFRIYCRCFNHKIMIEMEETL
jgi:hypothetical protein